MYYVLWNLAKSIKGKKLISGLPMNSEWISKALNKKEIELMKEFSLSCKYICVYLILYRCTVCTVYYFFFIIYG